MLTVNWHPTRKTLRQFAVLWLVFFAAAGVLRAWRTGAFASGAPLGFDGPWRAALLFWIAAVAVGVPGTIAPRLMRPIYVGWMAAAFPIGWTVSHVLLAVLYYGVFTPIGLVFRVMGRDRLERRLDRQAPTYWKEIGRAHV